VHKLLYTDEARKQIFHLDERTKQKIHEAVRQIAANPASGKMLTRELKDRWSYRVGDYRIIYRIYKTEILVLILTIGHRKEVYKKAARKNW